MFHKGGWYHAKHGEIDMTRHRVAVVVSVACFLSQESGLVCGMASVFLCVLFGTLIFACSVVSDAIFCNVHEVLQ